MALQVEIDPRSGFCGGVIRAISKAEEFLEAHPGEPLYSVGDIVHNEAELERLEGKGLRTVSKESMPAGQTLLIRAHGEPPATYARARELGCRVIDCTCPVVLQLQGIIREAYARVKPLGGQLIIFGKIGHAEVLGLVGQTQGHATVIENIGEIDKIDYSRDIYLYSQTTKSVLEFQRIVEEIKHRVKPGVTFRSFDTICRSVANRIPQIREFAARHELILFVSGAKSSNGRILFAECRDANPNSRLISNESEIDPSWLEGKERIGICGATSTPRWLMAQVRDHVAALQQRD